MAELPIIRQTKPHKPDFNKIRIPFPKLLIFLAISLFRPWISVVVIAAYFPEAGFVDFGKCNLVHPFRTFPEIQLWNDHANRTTMFLGQRCIFPMMGKQHVIIEKLIDPNIGCITVMGGEKDMPGI